MGRRAAHEDQQDQLRRLRAEQLSTALTTMPKPPADTVHGTQPGDPAKAANAIIAAVESDEPPEFYRSATVRSAHTAGSPQPDSTPSKPGSLTSSTEIDTELCR